jgi:hypothetical protein
MKQFSQYEVHEVALPWSDGTLSARLWIVGERTVVGVPEIGLHCYGKSQTEAVFRLFTSLLKYYRQLKMYKNRLPARGLDHLELLTGWVQSIEERMKAPKLEANVVSIGRRKR